MPYKVHEAAVSRTDPPRAPVELSIGTLSSATGVPVDTLRTWERRYGFPIPTTRTGGSHRRYAAQTIEQVRLIVRALELGHRASAVVGRDPDELRRLLGDAALAGAGPASAPASAPPPADSPQADARVIARWLAHTRAMDGDALLGDFQRGLAELPALSFLARRMGPYLERMGEAWASGELRISQEHFASEKVREFLSTEWRALGETAGAAAAVLATPPGEHHALGLHMAAWVVALAGVRVVFLGPSTPMAEVAFAVERYRAGGAVLSVAAGYTGDLARHLEELRASLAPGVALVLGGAGSAGFEQNLSGLSELFGWASSLAERANQG